MIFLIFLLRMLIYAVLYKPRSITLIYCILIYKTVILTVIFLKLPVFRLIDLFETESSISYKKIKMFEAEHVCLLIL